MEENPIVSTCFYFLYRIDETGGDGEVMVYHAGLRQSINRVMYREMRSLW